MNVAVLAGHIDLASEIGPAAKDYPAASGADSASPKHTCAIWGCCSTSPPKASTARRLASCWTISARPFRV